MRQGSRLVGIFQSFESVGRLRGRFADSAMQTERHSVLGSSSWAYWFGLDPPTQLLMLRGESTTEVCAGAGREVGIRELCTELFRVIELRSASSGITLTVLQA